MVCFEYNTLDIVPIVCRNFYILLVKNIKEVLPLTVIMGGLKIKLNLIVKGEKHDYAIIL